MTACSWMGIPLRSPLILASLTLCSKPDVQRHLIYFQHAIEYGAGAIVLPSIHPLRADETVGDPFVRMAAVSTGLPNTKTPMGFAVLGTTDNIVSIDYGLTLSREAVKLDVPVLGSIANIGSKENFLDVVRQLAAIQNLAGLELNFSCPNVLNGLEPSVELLEAIQDICGGRLPVSIKLAPKANYDFLLDYTHLFQGFTLSNAYTGLMPPQISQDHMTPFDDVEQWRPTGIYGPQEKLLTFYDIWKFKTNPKASHLPLSSVGGFVSGNDVIQALMLGADCVQLSSAVFWRGLSVFRTCVQQLSDFLEQWDLEQLKGSSLCYIMPSDAEMRGDWPIRKMRVDPEKCRNCTNCACVERSCYAFEKSGSKVPSIEQTLCSGCGWCKSLCPFGAVDLS